MEILLVSFCTDNIQVSKVKNPSPLARRSQSKKQQRDVRVTQWEEECVNRVQDGSCGKTSYFSTDAGPNILFKQREEHLKMLFSIS